MQLHPGLLDILVQAQPYGRRLVKRGLYARVSKMSKVPVHGVSLNHEIYGDGPRLTLFANLVGDSHSQCGQPMHWPGEATLH